MAAPLARFIAPAALFVAALAPMHGAPDPLRVIRALPDTAAAPNASIRVTFDRPVAGSLDYSVDPKTVLHVAPAVAGRVEWRDPVTIELTPTAPLRPGTHYTVVVDTTFHAMDGARLERPYRFDFRVGGPRLIGGRPVDERSQPTLVEPNATFDLVWSTPVDPARVAASTSIELGLTCGAVSGTTIRLRASGSRPLRDDDDWSLRQAGGPRRDRSADSLRRIVTLAPVTPLPLDCPAYVVAPSELDSTVAAPTVKWFFHTYAPLTLVAARCGDQENGQPCPDGPITLRFSTPVRGSALRRLAKLIPATRFTMSDTARESTSWQLDADLAPRTRYAVVLDTALHDTFGQRLTGNPAAGIETTGYEPDVSYTSGRLLVERKGFGTFPVSHVNVDTLIVTSALVPDSLESAFLRSANWRWGPLWAKLAKSATVTHVPVRHAPDTPLITGLRVPVAAGAHRGLVALRIDYPHPNAPARREGGPEIAVVQVTDLAVHAKVGAASAAVWVTRVSDGSAVAGATVTVHDVDGTVLASGSSDARGLAVFSQLVRKKPRPVTDPGEEADELFDDERSSAPGARDGYVEVITADDRALVGVSEYDPNLSPWQLGASPAWDAARLPIASAVFTERGIYRPGEPLYAKAILRRGPLGSLTAPPPRDSLRWVLYDREYQRQRDTVVRLNAFGSASLAITVPADAKLGEYTIGIEHVWEGRWQEIDRTGYRVAEYRPPEFLVDVAGPGGTLFAGDSLRATIESRYLFGAPMSRAAVEWRATLRPRSSWDADIPGLESGDWYVGDSGWWWDDDRASDGDSVVASAIDTLDAAGHHLVRLAMPEPTKGRAATLTITASVTDVNRQVVAGAMSVTVHPAEFYVAARPLGKSYFWRGGAPQSVGVIAVRPTGERRSGIAVKGTIVRREWHQVHRERNGAAETVGEWVSDTVAHCAVTTAADPVPCDFTPAEGGMYVVSFDAVDARHRAVHTAFVRWASGTDWVPWEDESRFRMDLVADRTRYNVGDTATVMVASPFTNAEAWVTVEREGLLEQRRMTITSGSTLLKFPITEAWAPNAYVSVLVTRGRSAPPGKLDDPGRPTMRVGYVELRVTPETKRLAVTVKPERGEYRPGDTARVALHVADARGAGRRAEVTLWAVDEGVLALTGYKTPDPLDLIYQERGLGMRLASNLVSVAPQIPEGEKGRNPGGGGGADGADVLRSRFKTTAFFLGSVVTDVSGNAVAGAKLPDNLTTFRVMAVAATDGDRFGKGDAKMLVTRPLVARPALPRFVRPGDEFTAGTVVNRRSGAPGPVSVLAAVTGAELRGEAQQQAALEAGRGTEIRFPFRIPSTTAGDGGDTAAFRFTATGGADVDAVLTRIPYRPDYHPRAYTASGVLHDSTSVELVVPDGTDPARSRVEIGVGGSVLALVRGAYDELRVYPWYCTEQVTSAARPLLALYTIGGAAASGVEVPATAKHDLELAVRMISERQREDGGIGYWGAEDWTTPWLTTYAAGFLVDARKAGIAVDDSVLARSATYLRRTLTKPEPADAPVRSWYSSRAAWLAERVATVDFLSQVKKPDIATENQLIALAAQLRWEDRARLAEVVARRGAMRTAAELLSSEWSQVQIEGRRAVLPAAATRDTFFYFPSTVRPAAQLLEATLAVAPTHPLVGPLVENVVQQGRATRWWNTQDWASAVEALAAFERARHTGTPGPIRVRSGGRVLLAVPSSVVTADSSLVLSGLLTSSAVGAELLHLDLDRGGAAANPAPVFYDVTVHEVPKQRPVRPDDHGVRVERWYEKYDTRAPITSIAEGELVRVHLRITVPADREFLVLDDPLPAGLEAVDLSLRTAAPLPGPAARAANGSEAAREDEDVKWGYGTWDSGWWSPFDHRELRDERVVYFATYLWKGTYNATYVARATTPGVFVRPPAHAEEMYNPAVFGRSDGGVFTVTKKSP